jgi:hypothetical protein
MQVKFEIAGVQLKESEAKTLLSIGNTMPTLTVDLLDHVDVKLLDSGKLFNLSIEKKHPELAAIAAKLAITGPIKAPKRKVKRNSLSELEVKKISLDEALDSLCTSTSLRNVGAAMILQSLANTNKATIRQIAVDQVNSLWDQDVSTKSELFLGFHRAQGRFAPFVSKAKKGLITYHSSPLYSALRDGTAWLKQAGFLEVTEGTEFGSVDKKLNGVERHLQRKVYTLSLSESGEVLADTWADISDFTVNFWNNRLV